MKVCNKCKKEKTIENFYKNSKGKLGVGQTCKNCISKYTKKRYPGIKEQNKKNFIKFKYGISWKEYLDLYDSQEGKCKICKEFISIEIGHDNSAVIDHSHNTGQVRSLLCGSCNKLLGFAKDNIQILQESIKYLKENE